MIAGNIFAIILILLVLLFIYTAACIYFGNDM